ncbi:4Fe-4S binding protein [bacterium]|nr:4Fe-4S binding protein [bacterium]
MKSKFWNEDNTGLTPLVFWVIIIVSLASIIIGSLLSQPDLVGPQMTYGNFDIQGITSFVNRLIPGISDSASKKEYEFDHIHWTPFIILVGGLFPIMLFWGVFRNWELFQYGSKRVFSQWIFFVIARLGVIRVSGMAPVKRSCLGTFPFLNCQACEMATGACPIGFIQNLLIQGIWPFYFFGSMLLFGLALGKSICGWLCPFGFISDILDRWSTHRYKLPSNLSYLRYWTMAAVVISPVLYLWFGIFDRNFFCSTICLSGKILGLAPYYLTTGAISVFPVSQWIGDFFGPGFFVWFHLCLTLLFLIAMILLSGRLFCRVFCPLGGFWGLFYPVSFVGIQHKSSLCKRCGTCEKVCPMGVSQAFSGFLDRSGCMVCGRCVSSCKSGAREFRWGFPIKTLRGEKHLTDPLSLGYGSVYNKLRSNLFLLGMSLSAKNPLDMARYAYEQTSFYKQLYKMPPLSFESLPVVQKRDLGSCDPYSVLSDEMVGKVMYYAETTGSTGFPTPSFYSENEFHASRIFSKITPYIGGLEMVLSENRAVVNGLTFGFTIAGMSFGDFLAHHGGVVANIGSRSTIATPERMVRTIVKLRPSIITGTPIDFLCWMRILREDYPQEVSRVLEYLKAFVSTAELCSSSRSRVIQQSFNVFHVDNYACVEGFFSVPCPCGEKHILPIYFTELFDKDLKLIGQFGEGRFAFTNLAKKSSPLVRYLLDDFVTIFPSHCPFGFKKSVMPHGRYELNVSIGDRIFGVRHFEEALFKHGLFGDYRILIEDDGMKATLEEYGSHDSIESIEASLGSTFGIKSKVECVPFGTVTKYREVRVSKPILKVMDRRACSTQTIPEVL